MKSTLHRRLLRVSKRVLYGFLIQLMFSAIVITSANADPLINLINVEVTVTGKVLDETGLPLPGATVSVAGTTSGTITDIDGK